MYWETYKKFLICFIGRIVHLLPRRSVWARCTSQTRGNSTRCPLILILPSTVIANPSPLLTASVKIRFKAIEHLHPYVTGLPAHVKISYGKTYLNDTWLREGLISLADDQSLTIAKLSRQPYAYDLQMIARIFYVQSQAAFQSTKAMTQSSAQTWSYQASPFTFNHNYEARWSAAYSTSAGALVNQVFASELRAAQYVCRVPQPQRMESAPRPPQYPTFVGFMIFFARTTV